MKQDGCHKFANEDDAPPSTPVEKKASKNIEKYKQKIWERKISKTITQRVNFTC